MHDRRRRAALPIALCGLLALSACTGLPLELGPETLEVGVEGQAYSQMLSVNEGVDAGFRVVAGALPSGLALDPNDGLIAGTPHQSGTFSFTVRATQGLPQSRSGSSSYVLRVLPRLEADSDLPAGRVGDEYEGDFRISGGVRPYRADLVGLPAGLSFDEDTLRVRGTPLNASSGLTVELIVRDSGAPRQTIRPRFTLVIRAEAVEIVTETLPGGRTNQTYSQALEARKGETPYSWAVIAGVLPDGLRLNTETGTISGTPTQAGEFAFTVRVTDGDAPPSRATRELTIAVED